MNTCTHPHPQVLYKNHFKKHFPNISYGTKHWAGPKRWQDGYYLCLCPKVLHSQVANYLINFSGWNFMGMRPSLSTCGFQTLTSHLEIERYMCIFFQLKTYILKFRWDIYSNIYLLKITFYYYEWTMGNMQQPRLTSRSLCLLTKANFKKLHIFDHLYNILEMTKL